MVVDAPGRAPQLPTQGQVVEVRGSRWAVTDVVPQGLRRSSAHDSYTDFQHVVNLQSIDEDRLGEELSVVWELEVGNTLVPDQGLPEHLTADTFDDPNTLGAYVDAVRWGAVTSADETSFQSPFRSGANVEAYQLEPLRRALSSARTNLLLADDVGLGKTIEAGLVIQELLLRHRAQTVAIVCPPSLAIKWQEEMREKFGLDFVVVNSLTLADDRRKHGLAANPFRLHRRVIVSMAWLPTPRARRLLRDVYQAADGGSARSYAFDVLVVDEAHHVAPSSPSSVGGGRGYAVDSKRTVAVAELAKRCEHRLFLSATPHNGYSESFTALLEMIDNRRFARGATIDEKALSEVTVRRLKTQLADKDFKERAIQTIPFNPAPDEEAMFGKLVGLLAASAKANGKSAVGDILGLLLRKRLLSSPWSFALTLEQYEASPGAPILDFDDPYAELVGSDQTDEEEGLVEHPEFSAMTQAKATHPLSEATQDEVDRLTAWGRGFENRPDSRLDALLTFLNAVCRPDGRTWSNERVVVFTEYAATLEWLRRVLGSKKYDDTRLAVIQGATPAEDRELIRARFTAPPAEEPLRVLLATDAAGEGIDLQTYCHRLVNFDIPFNPSRLEQRIGRIDRYGQRETPTIYYLSPTAQSSAYALDHAFVRRIAQKVATIKDDLGAVNPVIDDEVKQHFMPGPRARAATKPQTSPQLEALKGEQNLNAQLTRLAASYGDTKAKLHLTPFNAQRVVETALAVTREPALKLLLGSPAEPEALTVDHLSSRWQPALEGLATRLTPDVMRPITFDENVARQDPGIVHIHLGHALLQKSSRLLRSGLFGASSDMHRVAAVVDDSIPDSCAAAVSRLVLVGRGGLRLHEEVFVTGIRLHGNDMAEDKVNDLLDKVLDRRDITPAGEAVRAHLATSWNAEDSKMRRRLEHAMQTRARKRQDAVQDTLDRRRDTDLKRAEEIYAKFRDNLRLSLDRLKKQETDEAFLLPIADDQKTQRRRDIRAMEDRLDMLDAEEARELEGITARYEDVRPYVSAAAVVFALTPAYAATFGGTQ